VSFDITNSGKCAGAGVPEVFVAATIPNVSRPPKELKGFLKVSLKPGETQHVSVPLTVRSFAYFDEEAKLWRAPAGTYQILVGQSLAEIDLSGEIHLRSTILEKP
jgi:beta-glucosidase